jgi:hypothetical protein
MNVRRQHVTGVAVAQFVQRHPPFLQELRHRVCQAPRSRLSQPKMLNQQKQKEEDRDRRQDPNYAAHIFSSLSLNFFRAKLVVHAIRCSKKAAKEPGTRS